MNSAYFSHGGHTLYHGDNLDILGKMPNESVHLVVTSPPYGELRDYQGFTHDPNQSLAECYRVLVEGGVVVWVENDQYIDGSRSLETWGRLIYAKGVIGFRVNDIMPWVKQGVQVVATTRYSQSWEPMLILSKGTPRTVNKIKDVPNQYAGKKLKRGEIGARADGQRTYTDEHRVIEPFGERTNVWKIPVGGYSTSPDMPGGKSSHPAPFPLQLAIDHIISWTNEGDTVLDPYCGSGTTMKAAQLSGRQSIGIEISKEYCEIIDSRMSQQSLL